MADNIYTKLAKARSMFLTCGAKKSGLNKFANFSYFELEDIIPHKTAIFEKLGLVDSVSFFAEQLGDTFFDVAELTLINAEKPEETIKFRSPVSYEGKGQNPIQNIGSAHTYLRRYLLLLCLDICECDEINATIEKPTAKAKSPADNQPTDNEMAKLDHLCVVYAKSHNTTADKVRKGLAKKVGEELTAASIGKYIIAINEEIKKGEAKE